MAFDVKDFIAGWSTQRPTGAPSRRSNKSRSGRAGRKQANGQRALQRVGGYRDPLRAIYAPDGHQLCVASDVTVKRFETIEVVDTIMKCSSIYEVLELKDHQGETVATTLKGL